MQTTFTSVIHPAPARNVSSKVRLSAVITNKVFPFYISKNIIIYNCLQETSWIIE